MGGGGGGVGKTGAYIGGVNHPKMVGLLLLYPHYSFVLPFNGFLRGQSFVGSKTKGSCHYRGSRTDTPVAGSLKNHKNHKTTSKKIWISQTNRRFHQKTIGTHRKREDYTRKPQRKSSKTGLSDASPRHLT